MENAPRAIGGDVISGSSIKLEATSSMVQNDDTVKQAGSGGLVAARIKTERMDAPLSRRSVVIESDFPFLDSDDEEPAVVVKGEPLSDDDADLLALDIDESHWNHPTVQTKRKSPVCADAPSLKLVQQQSELAESISIAPIPNTGELSSQNDRNEDESPQPSTAQANDDLVENANSEVEPGILTDSEPTTWLFSNIPQCPLQQCLVSPYRPSRTEATNSADPRQHDEQMHPNDPQPTLEKNTSESVELKESAPQPNIYCWACSKAETNLRFLQCPKCERHVHEKCLGKRSGSNRICIYCSKKDVFKSFDLERIPKILGFIKSVKKFAALKDINFTAEQTQKAVDFSKMEQKTYGSVKEFEEDIQWFQHNCRSIFPSVLEIQKASARLFACIKVHVQSAQIVLCDECYENAYKHFSGRPIIRPCSKPHLLLWAKVKGHCFWPAKVMDISEDRKKLYLQFFGDYTGSIRQITRKNCYLYSQEYPESKSHSDSTDYLAAQDDAREYIKHIQDEFPKFNYAKANVIFNPSKFDDYLNQMTAGWDETNAETSFDSNGNSASANNNATTDNGMRNQGTARKRNARGSNSNNSPRAKKSRYDKGLDHIEQAREEFQQAIYENTKLQDDLEKLDKEKKSLMQKNANLVNEKKELVAALKEEKKKLDDEKTNSEARYIALRNAMNEEKETLANEMKTLLEETSALKMEMEKLEAEKKVLKELNEGLQRFKNQMKSAFEFAA